MKQRNLSSFSSVFPPPRRATLMELLLKWGDEITTQGQNKKEGITPMLGPENKSSGFREGRHVPEQTVGGPAVLQEPSVPSKLGLSVTLPSETILGPSGGFLSGSVFLLYRPAYNRTPTVAFPQDPGQGRRLLSWISVSFPNLGPCSPVTLSFCTAPSLVVDTRGSLPEPLKSFSCYLL